MFKIITTKQYKSMEFNIGQGDLLLDLAERIISRQEKEIEELELKLATPVEETCVNVYKLNWMPERKKNGIGFNGTKKDLDKFIKKAKKQKDEK